MIRSIRFADENISVIVNGSTGDCVVLGLPDVYDINQAAYLIKALANRCAVLEVICERRDVWVRPFIAREVACGFVLLCEVCAVQENASHLGVDYGQPIECYGLVGSLKRCEHCSKEGVVH